ncbi:hypothetical protein Lal_00003561 [Lupinus albus]|nr:hypothetical protein Lal_00003561 [Lupinus albus]
MVPCFMLDVVQDDLKEINDVIYNIRESVKYINHNDSRMEACYDCPTRWNSIFDMLSHALKFKRFFVSYKDKEPHYICTFK